VTASGTFGANSLANLPVSLLEVGLRSCYGVPPHGLAHLGRLSALEHLALCDLPGATNDEGMGHLAPQLHGRLSALHFAGSSIALVRVQYGLALDRHMTCACWAGISSVTGKPAGSLVVMGRCPACRTTSARVSIK
jgi:hypothetical protein